MRGRCLSVYDSRLTLSVVLILHLPFLTYFRLLCSSFPYWPLVSTLPYSNTIYSYSRSVARFFKDTSRGGAMQRGDGANEAGGVGQVSGVVGEGFV